MAAYGSKTLYWKGKGSWCQRLFTPDNKFDPPCWKFDFYPDQEALAQIMALKNPTDGTSGLLNVLKKDDNGTYLQLKRPVHIKTRHGLQALMPPVIVDANDLPWTDTPIGNGSDLAVKIEHRTYPTPAKKRGNAIRLVGVKVLNLVPFEKKTDFPPDMAKAVEGLETQKATW